MASANPDILYKFESMRTKWRRCFEEDKPDIAKTVGHFFGRQFYRKHKHSTFVIGELPDGIFLFVKPAMYQNLKNKIEEQIEETLPDVRPTTGAIVIENEKCFPHEQSFREFLDARKEEHYKSVQRQNNIYSNKRLIAAHVTSAGG